MINLKKTVRGGSDDEEDFRQGTTSINIHDLDATPLTFKQITFDPETIKK